MEPAGIAAPRAFHAEDRPARQISVAEVARLLRGGGEIALLDVREEYDAAQGHILLASLLPLSQLELRIRALVPRPATRIILCDAGDGLAARAERTLRGLGYSNLHILDGGIAAWRAAGHPLFVTTHVLAKAFGGRVARAYRTPHITAQELRAQIEAGRDVAIFDARTFEEFQAGSLPGAVSCPLAELPARVPEAVPAPDTLIVVNCASRTRGILGAQSLINLPLPNPVAVLENGVMAWSLAGGQVVEGADRVAPAPARDSLPTRRQRARQLAARFAIPLIGRQVLNKFKTDHHRSLYLFDVRTPEAFAAGHRKDARSAPGGQLIMTLAQFVGTHMARVVLTDGGDGLAAVTTALWLAQIARHQVFVLLDDAPNEVVAGPELRQPAGLTGRAARVTVAQAAAAIAENDAVVIDVDSSLAYRNGHIPGARFAIRTRLPAGLDAIEDGRPVIITSSDGALAELTVQDLASGRNVAALQGGTAAWSAAGLRLEAGNGHELHPFEDLWPSPMRAKRAQQEAFRDYLAWEVSVADQAALEDTITFDLRPEAAEA
jgi:rhodanese-related sulfurtransferase